MSEHEGQPLLHEGPDLALASAAMIMIHGRGATAGDIMGLSSQFPHPNLAFLAPQAEGRSWYPYSFLVPTQQNEPGITSGMTVINSLVMEAEFHAIPRENVFILGFSQGACLALEFAARHPARYGGVFGLSGGLIGPPGTAWESEESLEGTPVFIGCSDVDPHIPQSRVEESAEALRGLGADVELQIYPGMGHVISGAELEAVNAIISNALRSSPDTPG
ncbi:MAG: alpha/beta hydrolase [Spirochaetota bacterium]